MIDINLFSGAGGLALGLKEAGFSPVHLYELDEHACTTLRHNTRGDGKTLSGRVHEGDVRQVDWESIGSPVRLLAAAVPCQPFSLAGKHLAQGDDRNLFPEVVSLVHLLQPRAVLIENVRGLLRCSFRPYFEYILRQLECPSFRPRPRELWQTHDERLRRWQCSIGYEPEYSISWRLLDAADFGVPQNRFRVFIVASRVELPLYVFPAPTHGKDALVRAQISGEYWARHGIRRASDDFQKRPYGSS